MSNITISYKLTSVADGKQFTIDIVLDAAHLEPVAPLPDILPEWTALAHCQCECCPLSESEHALCPAAARLSSLGNFFQALCSYDEMTLEVVTDERRILQSTTAQRALSSLMGLIIATSGCPVTAYFKPMARFHLPLSSHEETVYRATSMYMLAQFFRGKRGPSIDIDMNGLTEIYDAMRMVNVGLAERIRSATSADALVNAVVLLDTNALLLPSVVADSVPEVEYLFRAYL